MNRRYIVQISARTAAMTATHPAATIIGRRTSMAPCLGLIQAESLPDARPVCLREW